MIDIAKLKRPKYANGLYSTGDCGRKVVAVVHGEHLSGVLSGWENDLCIVKLDDPAGFLSENLFVPCNQCYMQVN